MKKYIIIILISSISFIFGFYLSEYKYYNYVNNNYPWDLHGYIKNTKEIICNKNINNFQFVVNNNEYAIILYHNNDNKKLNIIVVDKTGRMAKDYIECN